MRIGRKATLALTALGAAGAAIGLAACGGSSSSKTTSSTGGAAGVVTLRLGYVTPPAHPYGIAVNEYIKLVSTASQGKIKITPIPNYVGGDVPLLNDVIGGSVDMASVSSAVWGGKGVHSFDALQLPFLVNRYDLEREIIAGPIGKQMLAGVTKLGLVGLAIHEGGLRKPLAVKKAIVNLAGFKGVKFRSVQSPVLEAGLSALGASPTPIPVTDIFNALRNGTVDAMEANLGLVQTYKLYEVAKHITGNINLWPFPTVLVINTKAFDKLTPADQSIIKTQAAKIPGFSIDIFTKGPDTFTPKLCAEGVKFAKATPQALAQLQQAAIPVYKQFAAQDPQTATFIAEIGKLKAKLPPAPAPKPLPAGCAG